MKHPALVLTLATSLVSPLLFAQARPDTDRARSTSRPPTPPQPGERGDLFGRAGDSYSGNANSQNRVIRFDSRGRSARPVVVTSQSLDAKALSEVEEDLGIMARLIEKEIEQEAGADGMPNAMGIALTRMDGRGPTVQLLEGYGAVFTFSVRMPLTPPPPRVVEKKQERPTDSPWEQTRRELFGTPGEGGARGGSPDGSSGRSDNRLPGAGGFGMGGGGAMGFSGAGFNGDPFIGRQDSPAYDAKKVEALKKSIIEALKQAGHIRALKNDDYLTVVVQGGSSSGGGFGSAAVGVEVRTTTSSNGGPPRTETTVNRASTGDAARAGVLAVRVKKSEAEDFAKGKLTAEQFAKKALVTIR